MFDPSGGSREEARVAQPLLFWVKKEEITEGKKPLGKENKTAPPPSSHLLGQGLDPALDSFSISVMQRIMTREKWLKQR